MNREILFRGKDIRGDWHIGLLAHIRNGWFISNKVGISTAYEVRPETVGQFTGLTDKNGVKIFEGDIIKGKGKNVFAVEYSQNIAGFITKGFGVLCCPCMNAGTMEFYEVIGNIHENPELLE